KQQDIDESTEENFEDLTLIWLDSSLYELEHSLQLRIELEQIINYLKIFSNCDDCFHYMTSRNKNEKLFFIVSSSFGQRFIPRIQRLEQLINIYIYNRVKYSYNDAEWIKQYKKIHGSFGKVNDLLSKLTDDVKLFSKQQPISANIFTLDSTEKSIWDLSKENVKFMWYQLLIDILLRLPNHSTLLAKADMIELCRLQYKTNEKQLQLIGIFEKEYNSKSVISWYTRDCFLYKIINRACRTENIDVLVKFRFILADLHQELNDLYINQSLPRPLTVYRGMTMPADEFEMIQNNIGGRISINTFLSTTEYIQVAYSFAGDGSMRPEKESVVLIMNIDTRSSKTKLFADIQKYSFFQDEGEFLLSIETVLQSSLLKK
ncbi:unnamed protein product, partial [Didymodactylos carnosus]